MLNKQFVHDWRVVFSDEKRAFYLFDAENKIIAVFPQEKRDFNFFRQYVEFCMGFIETVFFYDAQHKKLYQRMAGTDRKKKLYRRIDKDI